MELKQKSIDKETTEKSKILPAVFCLGTAVDMGTLHGSFIFLVCSLDVSFVLRVFANGIDFV